MMAAAAPPQAFGFSNLLKLSSLPPSFYLPDLADLELLWQIWRLGARRRRLELLKKTHSCGEDDPSSYAPCSQPNALLAASGMRASPRPRSIQPNMSGFWVGSCATGRRESDENMCAGQKQDCRRENRRKLSWNRTKKLNCTVRIRTRSGTTYEISGKNILIISLWRCPCDDADGSCTRR